MKNKLSRQILGYGISGIIATSTDFLIYSMIIHFWQNYIIPKMISFICGTTVAYFCNRKITFQVKNYNHAQLVKFYLTYILSMAINVTMNLVGLSVTRSLFSHQLSIYIAFILATCCSIVINFSGQKFWVFRDR